MRDVARAQCQAFDIDTLVREALDFLMHHITVAFVAGIIHRRLLAIYVVGPKLIGRVSWVSTCTSLTALAAPEPDCHRYTARQSQ